MIPLRLIDTMANAPASPVTHLEGPAELVSRLRELGVHPGVAVQLLKQLPFQGPWIIRLGEVDLALRTEEAECIWINR